MESNAMLPDHQEEAVWKLVLHRLDLQDKSVEERHLSNIRRHDATMDLMQTLLSEQKKTNGNVIRHAEKISTLEDKVRELFRQVRSKTGNITIKDVGLWIAIIVGAWYVLTQVLGFHK